MRIGFDAKRAFCNDRGLGVYGRGLVGALAERHPGHGYVLYTPSTGSPGRLGWARGLPGAEVVSPGGAPGTALGRAWAAARGALWRSCGVPRRLDADRVDVFHGLSAELPLGVGRGRARPRARAVVTVHDLLWRRRPRGLSAVDRAVHDAKCRLAVSRAHAVVAVSERTRRDVVGLLSVPEERVRVVHPSCGPAFFGDPPRERVESARRAHGLPGSYVLYVGAFDERKNVLSLLRAFRALGEGARGASLVLVGAGGAGRRRAQEEARRLGLGDRAAFPDGVPSGDLPAVYRGCLFLAWPSFFEGFGLPVLEAAASGRAVVTSRGTSMEEAAGDGALYVDPGSVRELRDAMGRLLSDGALRGELGRRGRARAERFRPERAADAMMGVYRSVMSETLGSRCSRSLSNSRTIRS